MKHHKSALPPPDIPFVIYPLPFLARENVTKRMHTTFIHPSETAENLDKDASRFAAPVYARLQLSSVVDANLLTRSIDRSCSSCDTFFLMHGYIDALNSSYKARKLGSPEGDKKVIKEIEN